MTSAFIKHIIDTTCHDCNVVVLKGFSPLIITELGVDFPLLDDYVIENGKIILENLKYTQIYILIESMKISCIN